MKKHLDFNLNDFVEQQRRLDYNYYRVDGWVIVLFKNEIVNYYADHGELDVDYLCRDEIFTTMVDALRDNLTITEVIAEYNEFRDQLWNNHKRTI